jgi:maltose phosphorylase
MEKAYSLYLRTSRLDLDDYNNDTENGCHITSMAGTWLAVVQGFGGMRVKNDKLYFHPQIPQQWKSYSFNILFREWSLKINISQSQQTIDNQSDTSINLVVSGRNYQIPARSRVDVSGEMVMA